MVTVGVSIPVPEPHSLVLRRARADSGDPLAPFVPPHITLLGPTEVAQHELPVFVEHVRRVAGGVPPFAVVLRGTGTFRPVSQVVFVHVAEGISACERLEAGIRQGHYHHELRFPYHPHVTVAHDVPPAALDRAVVELAPFSCRFDVAAVVVYRQLPDGLWEPTDTVPLGGAGT